MARPTKEEQKKREILLKYFRRDSEIYTSFEKSIEGLNQNDMIGMLIDQCKLRASYNKLKKIIVKSDNYNFSFEELKKLDINAHDYYVSLLINSKTIYPNGYYIGNDFTGNEIITGQQNSHLIKYLIDEVVLIEVFGKDRVKKLGSNGYPLYLYHLFYQLSDDEKQQLISHISKRPLGTRTIIDKVYGKYSSKIDMNNKNSFLVEIDFTQPLETIQSYINHLYQEHKEKRLITLFDYLGIERKIVKEHYIYKTNHHKPFNIILADKLFIYDAFKYGLNNEDIRQDINSYTNNIKNISNDKVNFKTINNYQKTMINFIDNHEFASFETGYIFQ